MHGFADPEIPTLNTVAYYERLIASQADSDGYGERKQALRRTEEFARLFLAPGVGHCGGGSGPDTIDLLDPLVQWVEQGIAPDQIIAAKVVNGMTTFTRPICPYPALPRYSGVGDNAERRPFAVNLGASSGKAPSETPSFQPYWGKPAVRNDRGDRGDRHHSKPGPRLDPTRQLFRQVALR